MACVIHTAYLYDRGGLTRIGEIIDLASLSWERVADDISFCDIKIENPSVACEALLGQMEPARHEIVVFRDQQRVWEGPLTLVTYERDRVVLQARDVMHYAYRMAQSRDYDNRYPNNTSCIDRSMAQLRNDLGRREVESPPINVVPYLTPIAQTGDARTSRFTTAFQKTIFDDIDDMAANSGMDYTVIGRRIVLHDTDTALGQLPTLTDGDFIGNIIVTAYGMETATLAVVTGADGQYGAAGGSHPYYGRWEIVDDAYDEEAGTDAPTQAELESQADRNLSGRIPTPIQVRIPDGSQLNPTAPIDLLDLVPGVLVPLRATLAGREFSQMQKLRKLKVSEDGSGEKIQITLVPAPENPRLPRPGVLRTNHARVPIAPAAAAPWSFVTGTGEVTTASVNTTTGLGPEGRTGFVRRVVTTAKTAGLSGWYYEDPTRPGSRGEYWSGGFWARFSHKVLVTPYLTFRVGATVVGSKTGSARYVDPGRWMFFRVDGAKSTSDYSTLQFLVMVSTYDSEPPEDSPGRIPVGGWYDATNMLLEPATRLSGSYFDGSFIDTPALVYAWTGTANSSNSTETAIPWEP